MSFWAASWSDHYLDWSQPTRLGSDQRLGQSNFWSLNCQSQPNNRPGFLATVCMYSTCDFLRYPKWFLISVLVVGKPGWESNPGSQNGNLERNQLGHPDSFIIIIYWPTGARHCPEKIKCIFYKAKFFSSDLFRF